MKSNTQNSAIAAQTGQKNANRTRQIRGWLFGLCAVCVASLVLNSIQYWKVVHTQTPPTAQEVANLVLAQLPAPTPTDLTNVMTAIGKVQTSADKAIAEVALVKTAVSAIQPTDLNPVLAAINGAKDEIPLSVWQSVTDGLFDQRNQQWLSLKKDGDGATFTMSATQPQ